MSDIVSKPTDVEDTYIPTESDLQTAKLLDTNDAMVWAEEFMKSFGDKLDQIDQDLMVGWFANAMAAQERKGLSWEDQGSIDPNDYTPLENFVAGALSTMPPFAHQYSPRALPYAREAFNAAARYQGE